MGHDVNIVTISGRLILDIEVRACPDGKPVADITLVSNRKRLPKDDPDRMKYAVLVKVTLWGDDADFWSGRGEKEIQPLRTGDEVFVQGMLYPDDFIPNGSDTKTSGRLRVDNVRELKLLRRARRNLVNNGDE